MRRADVVVVGAGVMGSAAAWRLARGGAGRVVLLEQFGIGHRRGSSHGASRIFRYSYDDPTYVDMAMRALPLWREIEAESGVELITTLGGLDFGSDADVQAHAEALGACGAALEIIDGVEANRRFPMIRLPAGEPALFQGDAGIAHADRAVRSFATAAAGMGVEIREGARVQGLESSSDAVEVRAGEESLRARAVVVTAGAWARTLLAPAGIDLPVRPTRQTAAYFAMDQISSSL